MSGNVLLLTRGLPGSGKTTLALGWLQAGGWRARVNRDCLRDMLFGPAYARTADQEAAVTEVQHRAVVRLLAGGWSVIVDDTNLDPAVMERWEQAAVEAAVWLRVIDLTGVPVATCVARDAGRPPGNGQVSGARVGPDVILGLAERWLHDRFREWLGGVEDAPTGREAPARP